MALMRSHVAARWTRRTILVIDHDPWVRATIKVACEVSGDTVLTASNGRTGLRVAQMEQPNVVILGLALPEVSGLAVLQTLKGQDATHETPIIILRSPGSTVPSDLAHRVDGCLTVPFSTQDVRDQVQWVLDRSRFSLLPSVDSQPSAVTPLMPRSVAQQTL